MIGNILQDEKFPGIHIAFGNPYGAHTGADLELHHPHRRRRPRLRHLDRRAADHARGVFAASLLTYRGLPNLSNSPIPQFPNSDFMVRRYRERFNREFSPERYETFVTSLEKRVGAHIGFPLSETPCFLPRELFATLVDASQTLVGQLLHNAEYRKAADAVVPAPFREARSPKPTFLAIDFGLVQGPSGWEARLVELQAFPSLYGFQLLLAETSRELYGLEELSPFAPDLTHDTYIRAVGNAIVGEHDPAEIVLLEIDPQQQKTWPDFAMTEQMWGVKAVDFREVEAPGPRLFFRRDGS